VSIETKEYIREALPFVRATSFPRANWTDVNSWSYRGPICLIRGSLGWYLLCDGPIHYAQDLIQNSNTHNRPEGLRLSLN
jgi:hypothetical protein